MVKRALDILIPAYNNLSGIQRIINFIPPNVYSKLRIVVSDDSTSDIVKNYVMNLTYDLDITYISGSKTGAIDNWNLLLQYVQSDYYMLLHHDEAIINFEFLDYLTNIKNSDNLVLILPYKIQSKENTWTLIDTWLQKTFLKKYLHYLPYINFLGPTGSLVVSKEFSVIKYSKDLIWLVDCYWYYQILSNNKARVKYNSKVTIYSYYYSKSITWSSGGSVKSFFFKEIYLIKRKLNSGESIVCIYMMRFLYRVAKTYRNLIVK